MSRYARSTRTSGALTAIARPPRPPEQPGEKTVGPPSKRLRELLGQARRAMDEDVEAELDRLAAARAESRAFILDVTEGEP